MVFVSDQDIFFQFTPMDGLVQINEKGNIISRNVLGDFISIIGAKDEEKAIHQFVEKYGYPLERTDIVGSIFSCDVAEFIEIIKRVQTMLQLVHELAKKEKDYGRIFENAHFLLIRDGNYLQNDRFCHFSLWDKISLHVANINVYRGDLDIDGPYHDSEYNVSWQDVPLFGRVITFSSL